MLKRLSHADDRYREIEQMLTLPDIVSNNKEYSKLIKEYKNLEPTIFKFREYKEAEKNLKDSEEMMRDNSLDPEFRDMAEEEFRECRDLLDQLMGELKILLMPRDPNDSKNVIVEIRQGAGGEEAALFGADLFRMYSMYSDIAEVMFVCSSWNRLRVLLYAAVSSLILLYSSPSELKNS